MVLIEVVIPLPPKKPIMASFLFLLLFYFPQKATIFLIIIHNSLASLTHLASRPLRLVGDEARAKRVNHH